MKNRKNDQNRWNENFLKKDLGQFIPFNDV